MRSNPHHPIMHLGRRTRSEHCRICSIETPQQPHQEQQHHTSTRRTPIVTSSPSPHLEPRLALRPIPPQGPVRPVCLGTGCRSTPSTGRMIAQPSLAPGGTFSNALLRGHPGRGRTTPSPSFLLSSLFFPNLYGSVGNTLGSRRRDAPDTRNGWARRFGQADGTGIDFFLSLCFTGAAGTAAGRGWGRAMPWGTDRPCCFFFVLFPQVCCARACMLGVPTTPERAPSLYPISLVPLVFLFGRRRAGCLGARNASGRRPDYLHLAYLLQAADRCNHNERTISSIICA